MQPEDRKPLAYFVMSLLATLVGVTVPMRYPSLWPEALDLLVWGGLAGMAACLAWLIYEHLGEAKQVWWRRHRVTSLIGMFICGVGFIGFAAAYFWPHPPPARAAPAIQAALPLPNGSPAMTENAPQPEKASRNFIEPDFPLLMKQIGSLNGIQGQKLTELYVGKWTKIQGSVDDTEIMSNDRVFVSLFAPEGGGFYFTYLTFDRKFSDQISVVNRKDIIFADCKIYSIDPVPDRTS